MINWRKYLTPGRVVFCALLIYLVLLLGQGLIQKRNLENERSQLEKRVGRQEVQKLYYSRLKQLLSQSWYLEKIARTKLQLVSKGETAYKVFEGGMTK